MKFIEISKNVCVNVDQIAWVKSENDGLSSVVYVGGKEYPSDIMYSMFVDMLQTSEETEDKMLNIMKTQGSYAG